MSIKIVTDSSSDIITLNGVEFASAPLKIITADKEYVDDENLDVFEIDDYVKSRLSNGELLEDIVDDLDTNTYLFNEI